MRAFRRNLAYKLLSLTVAILLYAIAYGQQNPTISRDVYINPEPQNLAPEMVLKSGPTGGMATVSGPTSAVEAFRSQAIKASVDLSRATPGVNKLLIRYQTEPGILDIVGPPSSEVTLEKKARVSWDVDVLYDDAAAPPGFAYDDPMVAPRQVAVSGLPSEVSRVDRVVAIVSDTGNPGETEHTVTADVVAQNIKRQVIDAVDIEPRTVQVTLRLKRAPATKSVVLSARIGGFPASGHVLVGYAFDPPQVNVTGSTAQLARLSSITVPIDISGLRTTETRRVRIPLPSNIMLVQPGSVTASVRLDVQPISIAPGPTPYPVPVATPTPLPVPSATPTAPIAQPTPVASPSASPNRSGGSGGADGREGTGR